MKTKPKGNDEQRPAPTPVNPVHVAWLAVEGEHRRLYAVRRDDAGRLVFYFDRDEVLEFQPRADFPPYPQDLRLLPQDVKSISRFPTGAYLLQTHSCGSGCGYMLRRKYKDSERCLIPAESEEHEHTAPHTQDATTKAKTKNIPKALSRKRAKAAKGNQTVKDKDDRAKIKAAVLRKIKRTYTPNHAHNDVANLCGSNENLLKLKEGPYSFISARSVRRIVLNK